MENIESAVTELPVIDDQKLEVGYRATARRELVRIKYRPFEAEGGDGWIYCYYFPYVRDAQRRAGRRRWPCKVGRTTDSVEECVAGQFKQSGIFEGPEIGFHSRVDGVVAFEAAMKRKLAHRKLGEAGAGIEWFETNLGEVRRAFREVRWPGRLSVIRRLIVAASMAIGRSRRGR
ncbi:MAG: GIY-YIG nuclease family protein [Parvularculaceae bacterium]